MINENFVILGAFINLLGGISYIKDTLSGKAKPNRVSWGLWFVVVMIAFSAEISQGVGIISLATFTVGFIPLLIFIASFMNKKAYWKITKFDLLCGTFAVIGIILWQITKVGNLAIIFMIFADLMAGVPTIVKSYKFPETENWMEYFTSGICVTTALLALRNWSFAYFAFPLYIFFFNLIIFTFLFRSKLTKILVFKSV